MIDLQALVEWTAEAAWHLSRPEASQWLERIEGHYRGIVLAVEGSTKGGRDEADLGLRVASNLVRFWWMSGRAARGRALLAELLPADGPPSSLRAGGLLALAALDFIEGRCDGARRSASRALAMYLELGNEAGVAASLDQLGTIAEKTGDPATARQYHGEARAIRALDDGPCAASYQAVIDEAETRGRKLVTDLESLAGWTAEAASHLSGPDQAEWLARIEGRYVGILLALERCAMGWSQQPELGLRIAANLGRFWWMSGRASRGRALLAELIPTRGAPSAVWADALLALAGVDYAEARFDEAMRHSSQSSAMYCQLADDCGRAASLNQLGMVAREAGDLAKARRHHENALALYVALGDERGAVSCRSNLGVVALYEGNLDAAEELHRAALAERRRLGDVRGVASLLGGLATIARLRGDPEGAQEMHEEALAMRRGLADPWGVAGSHVNLCLVAVQRGDLERAAEWLGEATVGFTKVGDRLGVCETLHARALLTAAEDLPAEAVRLFAVAETARADIGAPLPPVYRREADRLLAECKACVDKKAFDAAWKAGCSPRYSPFPLA